MDVDAVRGSPIGDLVAISGTDARTGEAYDHWAFVPKPLPRKVPLESDTWLVVVEAEAALARLDQAGRQIPNSALLLRPALRREAQSTSALEGTFAPFEDVLESEIDERAEIPETLREVLNFVVAAEQGFDWIRERPFSVSFLAELQRLLVRNTPSEHEDAGRIRTKQVVIGPRGSTVRDCRFVPPPPGVILDSDVDSLIGWINDPPAAMPRVVRAALAHYQVETLHPFSDGNGRIGRLLIVLQLLRDGSLREPLLVVSPWFEARRAEYQDGLLELSRSGNWDTWVRFFSRGVTAAADSTRVRVDELLRFADDARETVRGARISGVAERVAGELIGAPILTARVIATQHDVTHQGAIDALRRLVQAGLLRERVRRGRSVFVCDRVVEILGS